MGLLQFLKEYKEGGNLCALVFICLWKKNERLWSYAHKPETLGKSHAFSSLGNYAGALLLFSILLTKLLFQIDLLPHVSEPGLGSKYHSTYIIDSSRHILIDKHVAVFLGVFCHGALEWMSCRGVV